jgi:competence protein ComEC
VFSKEKILYTVVLGFSFGVATSALIEGVDFTLASLCLAAAAFGSFVFFRKRKVGVVILLITFTLSGFSRNELMEFFDGRPSQLNEHVKEKITLIGVLVEEQERRDFNTRLTVRVREVNGEHVPEPAWWQLGFGWPRQGQPKILVTTGNPKDFRYGDVVKISGELIRPENFYTETGREFDYVGYLETNDVRFLIRNASVETVGSDPPSVLLSVLFFAKRKFVESLGRMLPEPQSSLASGILIDGKQSINGELQEKFQKTGLIHIVVLSGSNVSIIASAIASTFYFLPRTAGLVSASIGIVLFALITGASSTVVRASIMAILVLLSRFSIRNYDPARGLFIASALMLMHNPSILLYSPSFQLSFLATFTVVKIIPTLEAGSFGKFVRFVPEKFGLRELVVSNIIVQIFLFPILTWMTGFFSAVSLPVNLLVLPLIPFTMLAAFLTAMTGMFSWFLGAPFAFVSNSLLSYELAVVEFFAKFSASKISFDIFSGWVVSFIYVMAIVWFLFFVKVKVDLTTSEVEK